MTKATVHIDGCMFEFDDSTGTLLPPDQSTTSIDIRKLSDGEFSILVNGESHHVFLRLESGVHCATVNNRTVEIRVERQRDRLLHALQMETDSQSATITHIAPMPGMVTKILKEVGSYVESGTGIVIIEAMKMENEITSKKSGTLSVLHVKENQTVEKNEQLFTIETL